MNIKSIAAALASVVAVPVMAIVSPLVVGVACVQNRKALVEGYRKDRDKLVERGGHKAPRTVSVLRQIAFLPAFFYESVGKGFGYSFAAGFTAMAFAAFPTIYSLPVVLPAAAVLYLCDKDFRDNV